MSVHTLDPLKDARWQKLVRENDRASVFHTRQWLHALRLTYGYEPLAVCTLSPELALANAVLFCRVESWLTGRRWVSLPYSDHCEPLAQDQVTASEIPLFLREVVSREKLKYMEVRLGSPDHFGLGFHESAQYCLHKIDLTQNEVTLFANMHHSSIRRKIQRAERQKLVSRVGFSELLPEFYRLFVMTRRRHGLPPSPMQWFENLLRCFGDGARITMAFKDERPVAGILTLTYNQSIVYKYGASDMRFSASGGMPFLFWRTMLDAKKQRLHSFDLGRTDLDNEGLLLFKDRLGGVRSRLRYWRISQAATDSAYGKSSLVKSVMRFIPDTVRIRLGALLYKHVG
jgi:hypothetical protein